jgi:hypothetical protein
MCQVKQKRLYCESIKSNDGRDIINPIKWEGRCPNRPFCLSVHRAWLTVEADRRWHRTANAVVHLSGRSWACTRSCWRWLRHDIRWGLMKCRRG